MELGVRREEGDGGVGLGVRLVGRGEKGELPGGQSGVCIRSGHGACGSVLVCTCRSVAGGYGPPGLRSTEASVCTQPPKPGYPNTISNPSQGQVTKASDTYLPSGSSQWP